VNDTDLAATFHVALGRIVRGLRQETAGSRVGPGGLSVLVTLDARGPQRVGVLAEVEGVAAPSMTRIVNALEAEGLVRRDADPVDGRAQVVAVTPEGTALLTSGKEVKLAALRRRLAALPPAERERLEAALPALELMGGAPAATP
jgi:DNA-binding MarR family transcriptional regulator